MQPKLSDDIDVARAGSDVEAVRVPAVVDITPAVALQLRGTLRDHHWTGYKSVMEIIEVLLFDSPEKWALIRKRLLDIANKGANEQDHIISAVIGGFSAEARKQIQQGAEK